MQKNKECEIIQDLLFSYQDDVLSSSSKKLVETHLRQCENCQKKLMEIKEESKNEKKQEKEIDYLKKIRRKAKIKSIFGILGGILLVFLIIYGYRFFVIHQVTNQYSKYLQKNNVYQEITQLRFQGEGAFVTKTWYKDGKYKRQNYQYTEQEGWEQIDRTEYGEIDSNQMIEIVEKEKKAVIKTWSWKEQKSNILHFPGNLEVYRKNFLFQIGAPFWTSIRTDTWHVGREYYILKQDRTENWFDKETGLPIREINVQGQTCYYPNTTIEKATEDLVTKYQYEFDKVKEEDVQMPDLTGYDIIEEDLMIN